MIDAKSGVSGAGRSLKATSHAGSVLENFAPYAVGAHRHAPEIAQQLGFPVCFVPHLLPVRRGLLATCYVQTDADAPRAARGGVRDERGRAHAPRRRRARARARPGHRRGRDRRVRRRRDRHDDRRSARSTTSARAPPGRPCRMRTSRSASTRRPGCACTGVLGMSVTAATGFVASGVHGGDQARGEARSRARALSGSRDGRRDVDAEPRARRRRSRVEAGISRSREPQAVVDQLGRSRTPRPAPRASGRRSRLPRAPLRCSGSCRSRCSCSRPA